MSTVVGQKHPFDTTQSLNVVDKMKGKEKQTLILIWDISLKNLVYCVIVCITELLGDSGWNYKLPSRDWGIK